MLLLGLETSCDETAAAVVENARIVRSSVIASQDELHAEYAGVVPEIASRAHAERILPVVRRAIADAGIRLAELDAVAVGHRPGLIGSLLVGVSAAKALAWSLGVPLLGVDHVHSHLYAGWLEDNAQGTGHRAQKAGPTAEQPPVANRQSPEDSYPALGLVVSGGHTTLYSCATPIELQRLGGTIDDALGEAFDKAATILGLPYPGGPNLDRLARTHGADNRTHDFPVSRLAPDSLDFSFSGLKTSLLYAVRGRPLPGGKFERDHTWLNAASRADFAASFQRAAVDAVILKLGRAAERGSADGGRYRTLVVGGGVTANSLLRTRLTEFARAQDLALRLPALRYCVDNAAMIAGLAHHLLSAGRTSGLDLEAVPTTAC
ncbi:MAG: tRNA (adenosine(37)-N6)-threonylcarbamoyltransferase complex transferase subunit TsaD [Phycisphaerales bacterium]